MLRKSNKKIGELLLKFNFVTEEQLQEAIKEQKKTNKKLGEQLVDMGYVNEDDLIQVLEFQLGIPHAELSKYVLNPHLSQYIPENLARQYDVVPLEQKGNKLRVAMADPSDIIAIDDIEMTSNLKVDPLIATHKEIRHAIGQIYSVSDAETKEVFASLSKFDSDGEPEIEELRRMVEDTPIVKLANIIISQALQSKSSDIHIEPQEEKIRVRYRIDGVLNENMTIPKHVQAALISRLKIIASLDITERRKPQDGRINMDISGVDVDMRVSTLPTIFGEKVVIRILNTGEGLLHLSDLGFSSHNLNRFKQLIKQPHGIILVTGPTGSGKSTTLFSSLNELNQIGTNIITVEDPVEYQLEGINQVQTAPKAGLTFANALRSILRQDPDIIMVGEIRDKETAEIAVKAALTGHLVLSTLHTNDAISSITRLVDMGVAPYLVASAVIGVVAQRLVRRICSGCKSKYEPGINELEFFEEKNIEQLYTGTGCRKCNSTGYRGRLPLHEILLLDSKLRQMIINNNHENDMKEYAKEQGMITLKNDGINKALKGFTDYKELLRIVI